MFGTLRRIAGALENIYKKRIAAVQKEAVKMT